MSDNISYVLTVWDSHQIPPDNIGVVYCWNGYEEKGSIHSLLSYVEKHDERLRQKYLSWIHDLGESLIGGRRLIDRLVIKEELSYWWMTLFVEKNAYISSIFEAIRLLALYEILEELKPKSIQLITANVVLHKIFKDVCHKLKIRYRWEKKSANTPHIGVKSIYYILPHPIKAMIEFGRYIQRHWALRKSHKPKWFEGDSTRFFCSYFDNINISAAKKGNFDSYYWSGLQTLLENQGYQSNWLQIYIPCEAIPNPHVAKHWTENFNNKSSHQRHFFLHSYLTWKIIYRVFLGWLHLWYLSWCLRGIKHFFSPDNSFLSLWLLMKDDWVASLSGKPAIDNLFSIELFDSIFKKAPYQKMGFYLCENQPWERALVYSWRKYGHGCIRGVAHATVRFWDLRYFLDSRTVESTEQNRIPQPDQIALNGQPAVNSYMSINYPEKKIIACEALRFGFLHNMKTIIRERRKDKVIHILILGDSVAFANNKMLRLLEEAVPYLSDQTIMCTVKPHPNCRINVSDYPSLKLKLVQNPLSEILHMFDVALSSNMTSAGVDAYLGGLPVVVILDETKLNFSPLRGQEDVSFVSTVSALVKALQLSYEKMGDKPNNRDFFFLDSELPKWSYLLAN
ncbi:MAG: hypothetical protein IPJ69_04530 [Deltaproteobacteria bacterium]|nr:MAG: hypothetical protein IPJ69_04530 [Deltaproteobacteria bacterium]